ncbi:hypothetical protein MS2017_1120 [Bathymodiolus thermophilus thioautotrophic gill symbiont]|uniref:Uncharacterized protein n=1 Tax=Bathymodiolus thermophilus thioautotrophic gill symbiont TaxID=2360 RepID=A0A3G3IMN3_9GAMM|nr:hypothetical protein [Bathymodiolus thermophilus thioautotrophic gill symbiont]AYQ56824.1 hypothetical protein MS2017_1120 [Bathymodiolus thermophilus thioautotrophic gill symbiont]CAB5495720.1 hypothetical protein THERMOS_350 [Bathymodiolus thermophilus thioautotrophic gill symbiont]
MFKPNTQFNNDKHNYYVALDHVIASDNASEVDDIHFISEQKTIGNLEISFINDYKITEQANPIGFWQTILNNYKFNYSSNFKYKFTIDTELYLISFDTSKGITLHADANLVRLDEFNDIEVNPNNFNIFKVIKTKRQAKQENSLFWRNTILQHVVFYVLFLSGIFAYYQYKANTFSEINKSLFPLKVTAMNLNEEINNIKGSVIVLEATIQQAHIENLLYIVESVNIKNSTIDLTQSSAVITVSLSDLDMVKHLAKTNNIALTINRNFIDDTADVSWKVKDDL